MSVRISALDLAHENGSAPLNCDFIIKLLRLHRRKLDVLRFLVDPTVPFTNNLAEREGRMMKLRQKISGGFRSVAGAKDFAVLRTLISIARKQGWQLLNALSTHYAVLIDQLRLT